jgi:mono/diheme cytochrome c family protein
LDLIYFVYRTMPSIATFAWARQGPGTMGRQLHPAQAACIADRVAGVERTNEMSNSLKWLGASSIVLFVAMQFARPARIDRAVDKSQTIEAVTRMPADTAAVFDRSCGNCHSENTHWRWYSNVAPVSWLQMADVGMARDAMNFSRWSTLTPAQQADRLKHIYRLVRSGDMPPWYYKPLHPGGWLSQDDVTLISQWVQAEQQRLASIPR